MWTIFARRDPTAAPWGVWAMLVGLLAGAHAVSGQDVPGASGASAQGLTPLVAPRIANAPLIDGVMEPGEWDQSVSVSRFTQREPREGEPLSERTELRLARTDDHLFLAFVAYDQDMASVRAELTSRDRYESSADVVMVVIDPVQSKSRGYVFLFNPLGVQYDGIWSRGPDLGWDGVLDSRGRVEADRYVVEIAIPFSTVLTGGTAGDSWDVNFGRRIPRKGEEGWWVPLPRSDSWRLFAHAGELSGMTNAGARTRLELIPTATAQGGARQGPASAALDASWGVTARVPASEAVRIEGTYRPDFTFVETDAAQIGFNERYALFYPEKRPFFLEAADRFGTRAASFVSDPLSLVHTRAIVRPRMGGRVLASPGGGFLGGMVLAEEDAAGNAAGTSAIIRALLDRADGVMAGLTATHRGREGRRNTVIGADVQAHLPGDLVVTAQAAHSLTDEAGLARPRRGSAAYVDIARETGGAAQQLVFRKVEREFEADLGFVPRNDARQILGHFGAYWRPRSGSVLSVFPMTQDFVVFDDEGRRVEIEHLPHVELLLTRQTVVWLGYRFGEESFRGRTYSQARSEARISSTPWPWLDLSVGGKIGRRVRYDTENTSRDETFVASFCEVRAEASLRPDGATTLSGSGTWRRLGGNARLSPRDAWLVYVRAVRFLSNTTYLRAVAQYDPDQERREASLLLGREINYGTQLHLGADYSSARLTSESVRTSNASFFMRISYLLHR